MTDPDVELPQGATEDTTREERAAAWTEMNDRMSELLDRLLGSPSYGRRETGRPPAPDSHGVYLFSDAGEPQYVGRTGRTERSIRAGKKSASGFRARLAGHSRPSSGLSSASFALRIALGWAADEQLVLPANRSDVLSNGHFAELFSTAKERITGMDFQVVPIEQDRESAVFEVYAAFVLATPFNSFATS